MHKDPDGGPFVPRAKRYAEARGYGFLVPNSACDLPDVPKSWHKLALLRMAMMEEAPGAEASHGWLLWLDSIALVTNLDVRVESFVTTESAQKALLLVGADAQPPFLANVQVLLARKSFAGARLIDSIWKAGVMRGDTQVG